MQYTRHRHTIMANVLFITEFDTRKGADMEATYHIVKHSVDPDILQQYAHIRVIESLHMTPIESTGPIIFYADYVPECSTTYAVCNLSDEDRIILTLQGNYIKSVTAAQISQRVYEELKDALSSM